MTRAKWAGVLPLAAVLWLGVLSRSCAGGVCGSPTEVFHEGEPTGLVECADGSLDSVAVRPPTLEPDRGLCVTEVGDGECSEDADCVGPGASCIETGATLQFCVCVNQCGDGGITCASGEACLPASTFNGEMNVCVPAECTVAEDCPSRRCGVFVDRGSGCTFPEAAMACRDPKVDECQSHSDCTDYEICRWNDAEGWHCASEDFCD